MPSQEPTRLSQLSTVVATYGETSVVWARTVNRVGNAVVTALPAYLGSNAAVYGVPPEGEWKTAEFRDNKFSDFGTLLSVTPTQMGVAVVIPYTKGDGYTAVRVVVEFSMKGKDIKVSVGDEDQVPLLINETDANFVEAICERIFQYLMALFTKPVLIASAIDAGKFGFLPRKPKAGVF